MKFKQLITLLCLFALVGCAYEWRHPQKNKQAYYSDSQQCEVKALQMYPQVFTNEVVGTYQSAKGFVTPKFETVDINIANRRKAVSDCLRSLGWYLEKKQ